MSPTPKDRLTDIAEAAAAVRKATQAIERAGADGSEDEAQLAFDALLYRLRIRLCADLRRRRNELEYPHLPADTATAEGARRAASDAQLLITAADRPSPNCLSLPSSAIVPAESPATARMPSNLGT